MNKRYWILALLVSFSYFNQIDAQRNCTAVEMYEQEVKNDPSRALRLQNIEEHTRKIINNPANQKMTGIITIPVVFHVVYNNETENISDAQLQSQIDVLNEDFRRTNADQDNVWPQAADSEIEFCLASVDPSGNPTTGITRTETAVTSFGPTGNPMKFNSSGGKDAWPADSYMNFWVCDLTGGLLGYAQFPGGPAATDGVVCDYAYTGRIGTATAPFDGGRTGTHEVGHYLNLRHIWGDGPCSQDDFVADTPTSDASNGGCPLGHISCDTEDMVQNYMDYTNDECMNLFTAGQKDRMRAIFDAGGARESLLNSVACGPPPPPTCDDGVKNGDETGVDCGGSCAPCGSGPTCDDGIQNGDETGVDCGGSMCAACPGPCGADKQVVVQIILDNYPEETSWEIRNESGTVVANGGTYGSQPDGSTITIEQCFPDGCYEFEIFDAFGDGICCGYGNGSYSVASEGQNIASGGSFQSSDLTPFCLGNPPAPTCDDGVQNGDETGVDCGGTTCAPCPTCSDGIQNGDETDVDCGGSCAPCPTCDDGIQNGSETGVDCGGSCAPCTSCNDGVQNGDETGVDCGGSCAPCPTCNDGIQNGDETGVDCGGETCAPCATCSDGILNGDETGVDCGGSCAPCNGCNGTEVSVTLNFDNYPEETSWEIRNASGSVVASGGSYGSQADGSTLVLIECLVDGCYEFTINDAFGDGICCGYGSGSYSVTAGSTTFASGGSFNSSDTTPFCLGGGGGPTCSDGIMNGDETGVDCGGSSCAPCGGGPTCSDGIQNGDETGVDCGGSSCAACGGGPTCDDGIQNGDEIGIDCGGSTCEPCATCSDGVQNGDEDGIDCGGSNCAPCGGCTYAILDENDFESGFGIWNDGGSDCRRSSTDQQYANSGIYCIRLRDNTSTSVLTTDNLALASASSVLIEFSYIAVSMDNANEDFWLQISTNGGGSYTTVEEWNRGDEFENNVREAGSVEISGPFTNNTRFRFRCDASTNSDLVYLDDIRISSCGGGGSRTVVQSGSKEPKTFDNEEWAPSLANAILYPNPANDEVTLYYELEQPEEVQIAVYDIAGKRLIHQELRQEAGQHEVNLQVSDLNQGLYHAVIQSGKERIIKKFVITRR